MNGHGILVRTAVIAFCLTAGGCAGLTSVEETSLRTSPPPPEGKRLTELTASAFATAKLAGTPQVSPVRATHDSQWGDWMFCVTGSNPANQTRFAVLVGHDAVLEVRSSVLIDGCEKETYHPLEAADPGKAKPNSKPAGTPASPQLQPAGLQRSAL